MALGLGRMTYPSLPIVITLESGGGVDTSVLHIYLGTLSTRTDSVCIRTSRNATAEDVVKAIVYRLRLGHCENYELAETFSTRGRVCKERRLEATECPVRVQSIWPIVSPLIVEHHRTEYRFFLVKRDADRQKGVWIEYAESNNPLDSYLTAFMYDAIERKEYTDLCNLPTLNENTLLENLRRRFKDGNIYTYVGSILISVNPFKFFPIYNPKYVKMYQNRRLGELPPHIFAIADAAYHAMLHKKKNQCVVISGESGSGKTECTNLLLHHLSALSQKGYYGNGIEQTILGAGPVLEFGNHLASSKGGRSVKLCPEFPAWKKRSWLEPYDTCV
ncbi:hypothetical protein LSH36_107g01004 [Paralvinella palmiformis]|uniref:Myosin motor domain-containing protein n=1 Tax=Paralvinella palmiformis TaxID=53620 RepID=A0AAD9NC95_9ANNE|nr:hypothetical protein LSH36_107g01004 [Paralvinella palmiformis]